MFWQGHSLSTHYCGFHFTAIPNNRTISLLSGNLCARAWGFSLLSARGSRARVFFVTKLRLAVTAASDRLRLACVKKSGSLPRFVPNRVFRIFSLATLALRPLCPPS